VMDLNRSEVSKIRHLEDEYGLNVSSIGSPIGKVKLLNVDDKTKNRYVPFKKYLSSEVKKACDRAHAFETKLIRGFSFYHPRGTDAWDHLPQVVDQLGQIAETCHRSDLTFGLEVEANLVGQNGEILDAIHRQVNHPALVLIYDAGNIITQGYSTSQTIEQYQHMKRGLGWIHIKDYRHPAPTQRQDHVDEEALKHFVPADIGDSAHEVILRDFKKQLPKLERKLRRRGIPGVFLDLEPHVKGGGQFGGFSGPDGMGVALRGLCRVLDYVGIDYHLRDFDDVIADRGF
jgi:sugar phosphate isomerase/epimerase